MKIAMGQITTLTKDMETDAKSYQKYGLVYLELAFPKVYDYLKTHTLAELKALLDEHGLKATSAIGMAPTSAGVLYVRGEEAETYFENLEAQTEMCSFLGCELINVGADPDELQYPGWREQAVKNLRRAGEIAQKFNMKIALEDGDLGRAISLVDEANRENVGYCIDYFWYFKHGQTAEAFKTVDFSRLFHVHFCDLPEGYDVETMDDSVRVLPGEGVLPLLSWSKLMKEKGFTGYLSLELLNEEIWAMPADEASEACMRAMRPYEAL